ncbi:hypothetical protein [Microbacterium sp. UBA3486]|uniref:hypothetical protein n=1 Tax=Microbacterium TaxID=33882 RepID=UPI0025E2FEC3|nr:MULTISPECIES: hypothetical protein [Microbacterium]
MATWYTSDGGSGSNRLDGAWPDAPTDNIELCEFLMDTARQQVLAYAPTETAADEVSNLLDCLGYPSSTIADVLALLDAEAPEVPTRYVFAQLQQAKNLFNAGRIVGDGVGPEGFSFVPRPLSKEIQKIIRPQSGVASVL